MDSTALARKIALYATQPVTLVLLILAVVALCIAQTYQRVAENPAGPGSSTSSAASSASESAAGLSSAQIIGMNLFGSSTTPRQATVEPENIPVTRLKLVLKGAFSHSDPSLSSALIATDERKGAIRYHIDDELPGNATLVEVHPNYVVLKRGLRLEKLLFPRDQRTALQQAEGGYRQQSQRQSPGQEFQDDFESDDLPEDQPVAEKRQNSQSSGNKSSENNTGRQPSLQEIRERFRQQKP